MNCRRGAVALAFKGRKEETTTFFTAEPQRRGGTEGEKKKRIIVWVSVAEYGWAARFRVRENAVLL